MTDALERLRRVADSWPDGQLIPLPVEFVRDALMQVDSLHGQDLSVSDVAGHFGRSVSTVRAWLEKGILRGYKLRGKAWRIPPAAVEEFEEAERSGGQGSRQTQPGTADLSAWRWAS